jgi:hypothetical protein
MKRGEECYFAYATDSFKLNLHYVGGRASVCTMEANILYTVYLLFFASRFSL